MARAAIVRTLGCSTAVLLGLAPIAVPLTCLGSSVNKAGARQATRDSIYGNTAGPRRSAICWIILAPVCLASHVLFDWQTAFKKGIIAATPRDDATTAKARAVVFLTYSSACSRSGRIAANMEANPAALAKCAMMDLPSCLA